MQDAMLPVPARPRKGAQAGICLRLVAGTGSVRTKELECLINLTWSRENLD